MNPTDIKMQRSTFNRSHSIKTSFNVGEIIPFLCDEVLPGDTFNISTSKVVRLQSLITPMMDNLYLDTYYFFVPNRIVWDHWRELNGENTQSAWAPEIEYEVPQLEAPTGGWEDGTLADYFGIPTFVEGLSVNAMPFRAYSLICNDWFRDENLCDPLNIPTGDSTITGSNGDTYIIDVAKGGKPYKAAKYQDYFTSCLPAPQKGPDVTIPVSTGANYPVVALENSIDSKYYPMSPLLARKTSGADAPKNLTNDVVLDKARFTQDSGANMSTNAFTFSANVIGTNLSFDNLYAISDGTAAMATINQLRMAFQIQKLYEKDARGGTRYIELLKSHFGVTSPDARLQRPEYLGGNRIPISINQVLQQSQTTEDSPQGNPAGMSFTTDKHSDFTKSFVEHGFVIGLMVARYNHTYQQGLERFWSRKNRFDYYWPVFANIGEQAILNKEIYAQGTEEDDEVFGYQEAWADYRYKPNRVTGEMRSNAPNGSLDVWHLADDYSGVPRLSAEWIAENPENLDRVIAVTSRISDQIFADLYIKNKTTRPLPMYSIPGLIDHH